MRRIFLLEDDPILGKAIQLQLEVEGFNITWCRSISEAKTIKLNLGSPDLYLLDVNLGDGTGFQFCEWLRESGERAPAIFLTARTDEDSVVAGFESGANDYLRKPFSQKELRARIKNQLSEEKPQLELIRFAGLTLIKNQQALKQHDNIIALNRREFEILTMFFENPETIITREQLIARLSFGEEIYDRTVDSHISHLRSKLQKNGILEVKIGSIYGQGYRLEKNI